MEQIADRLRGGERILLTEVHEGLLCYLHWVNGWPPLYPTIGEMSVETAEVFTYCLTTHVAYVEMQQKKQQQQAGEDNLLAIAQATKAALWAEMVQ